MSYPIKKLWELYDITSSKRVFQSEWKKEWVPFYRAREIVKLAQNGYVNNDLYISKEMYQEYSEKYWIPKKGDIMITWVWTIGICYVVKENDKFYFKDWNIIWLKDKLWLANSQFIEYAFKTNFIRKQIDNNAGSVVSTYTIINAKNTKIPLPPLPTQKLIIQKLDSSFKKIDKSIELTKNNLQNLEQLNKSVLEEVFSNNNYEKKIIEKVFKIKSWNFLPKSKMVEAWTIDVYWWNWINWKHNDYNLEWENIIIWRVWALCWNVRLVNWKIWLTDNAFFISEYLIDNIDKSFLKIFLEYSNLWNTANKMAQPVISFKSISDIQIPLPPLPKQKEIVTYLDQVFEKNKSLKSEYERKLKDLEELKQSLLKEAFEWRLVKE